MHTLQEITQAAAVPIRLAYGLRESGQHLGGICSKSVAKLVKAGEIHAFKVGGVVQITHSELVRYLESKMAASIASAPATMPPSTLTE